MGFNALGLLDAMKAHPVAFEDLMCRKPQPLNSDAMEHLYEPVMSEPGSNRRTLENKVYAWWLDSLQDIEGDYFILSVVSSNCR